MTDEIGEPASDDEAPCVDVERWRAQLRSKREEKDAFFADHPQSPIPPGEREEFDGLSYFEPDPTYRVSATVTVHDDPDPVPMDTTTGRELRYLRIATLEFTLPRADPDRTVPRADSDETAGRFELAAYQQDGARDEVLFVPFRDKTTGQQTYASGRYMELEAERALETDEEIVVDFNLAYAPFCAYSETFDCPLPPTENWLDVSISAGERV